jgi:hypothetical protein
MTTQRALFALLSASSVLVGSLHAAGHIADKPNIVVILADDLVLQHHFGI